MDEDLRKALDELEEAEREMIEGEAWSERDPDDVFYTAACQLAYLWRDIKNPKEQKPGRFQTGVAFFRDPLGRLGMAPVYEEPSD